MHGVCCLETKRDANGPEAEQIHIKRMASDSAPRAVLEGFGIEPLEDTIDTLRRVLERQFHDVVDDRQVAAIAVEDTKLAADGLEIVGPQIDRQRR